MYPLNESAERDGLDEAEQIEPGGWEGVENAAAQIAAEEIGGEQREREHVGDAIGRWGGSEEGAHEEREAEWPERVQHAAHEEQKEGETLREEAHHRDRDANGDDEQHRQVHEQPGNPAS